MQLLSRVLMYVLLIFLLLICIVPFYLMLVNGTRSTAEIHRGLQFFPGTFLARNYATLLDDLNIFQGFLNSAFIAIVATVFSSYISSLTAYGFAMFRFPGRTVLFGFVLTLMMVPPQLSMIGYFELLTTIGLLDSFLALILPVGANAFVIFFLRQYLLTVIPSSIQDAARIDGAGPLGIFHRIILPIMVPGIATMAVFTFVSVWNNYLIPLIVIFSPEKYTIPLMIAQLNSSTYKTDFGAVYLAVGLSILPILIAFSFFSRYIIAGVAFGGSKE